MEITKAAPADNTNIVQQSARIAISTTGAITAEYLDTNLAIVYFRSYVIFVINKMVYPA